MPARQHANSYSHSKVSSIFSQANIGQMERQPNRNLRTPKRVFPATNVVFLQPTSVFPATNISFLHSSVARCYGSALSGSVNQFLFFLQLND
jgi:hypothetical protein